MCFATIPLVTNHGAGIGSSVTIEKIRHTTGEKHTVIEDLLSEYEIDRSTCEQEVLPFVEKMVKDEILILE